MTEIELEMENDTELRIECEQIYIMDDYEQLKNKPRLNGKEISGDMYETDPTIPEWAKAQNKPSYTPEEVNAVNNDNVIKALGYTPPKENTTYAVMKGATASAAGTS